MSQSVGNEDTHSLAMERCTEAERDVHTVGFGIKGCLLPLPQQYLAVTSYGKQVIAGFILVSSVSTDEFSRSVLTALPLPCDQISVKRIPLSSGT